MRLQTYFISCHFPQQFKIIPNFKLKNTLQIFPVKHCWKATHIFFCFLSWKKKNVLVILSWQGTNYYLCLATYLLEMLNISITFITQSHCSIPVLESFKSIYSVRHHNTNGLFSHSSKESIWNPEFLPLPLIFSISLSTASRKLYNSSILCSVVEKSSIEIILILEYRLLESSLKTKQVIWALK